MLKQCMLLAALGVGALVVGATEAQSAYIVDSGTPAPGTVARSVSPRQSLAGQFTVGTSHVVTSVEAYMYELRTQDTLYTIALHGPNGNVPGAVLYEQTFNPSTVLSWQGVFGLDWAIGPETYWVSFVTDVDFGSGIYSDAPTPLDEYAISSENVAWRDNGPDFWDFLASAMRVGGYEVASAVPLPATLPLLAAGLIGLAAARRRKTV